jgi:hypothetical protein
VDQFFATATHVRRSVKIIVGYVDVFATSSWLPADEQPRLLFVVDAI